MKGDAKRTYAACAIRCKASWQDIPAEKFDVKVFVDYYSTDIVKFI